MNYKELADLILPDVKPISYYEEMYPERDLPEGAIVTRFAPSPTGFVHIGGIYQSLIAKFISKQTNGVFYLRIEDTDQKREIENGIIDIVNSLNVFDLAPDEGMINENEWIGNYGSYKQSMRKDIYNSFIKYFLEMGKAYPDFSTHEEDEDIRKKQEAAGVRPGCYGVWARYRDLPLDEAAERIKRGESYVIRFKSPGNENKKIVIQDLIKGKVVFPEYDLDIIIRKSDGLPTYHFAHLVDDHLMRTTHVIRGDEWLSSVPLHIQLFQEAGFKAPKYCHISPIMKNDNGNKRKLSKRKDPEAAVSYYEEIGVPSDSIKEYLLNIANSNFENWRKANKDVDLFDFDFQLNKMSVSGALFDMAKFLDVSKNVISIYSAEKIYDEAYIWAKKFDDELAEMLGDKEYALKIFGIERNNSNKPRKDIAKWSDVKENIIYMYERPTEFDFDKINCDELSRVLTNFVETYDENDDNQAWFEKMKDVAEKCGYAREVKEFKQNPENWPGHVGDVSTAIRVALTGRRNTPDLCEIMKVLGRDEVIARLNNFIK